MLARAALGLALAVAGCGRFGYDATAGAESDADVSESVDARGLDAADGTAQASCWNVWLDGTVQFEDPVVIAELSTASVERTPIWSPTD